MKTLLAIFAALMLISAPAMAASEADHAAHDTSVVATPLTEQTPQDAHEAHEAHDAHEGHAHDTTVEPVAQPTEADGAAIITPELQAIEAACTSETNEKVKLPEGASDAEQAQWDAAMAECLKNRGVATE